MDIIVNGARGRMGQRSAACCRRTDTGWPPRWTFRPGRLLCRLADYTGPADVVIDFSTTKGGGTHGLL